LGKIEYRTWENDKGEKRYSTDIVADRVELLGGRSASQADDDLPE
jgi:single-stranded DNA-binding protein